MAPVRMLAIALLGLVLGGFVIWVMIQMGDASNSMWRLGKMGLALLGLLIVMPLMYLLIAPLRPKKDSSSDS